MVVWLDWVQLSVWVLLCSCRQMTVGDINGLIKLNVQDGSLIPGH